MEQRADLEAMTEKRADLEAEESECPSAIGCQDDDEDGSYHDEDDKEEPAGGVAADTIPAEEDPLSKEGIDENELHAITHMDEVKTPLKNKRR